MRSYFCGEASRPRPLYFLGYVCILYVNWILTRS